ncbi:MAG: hypothetical protein ACYS8Z_07865 [Planctomycetota bacterium]
MPASSAFAEAHGGAQNVLIVEVVNETENGTPVTGDTVIVLIYDHGEVVKTLEGKVAEDGKAVFENLPTGEKIAAYPRAKHNDMMFSGNTVALLDIKNEFYTRVPVYDVSTDKSHLSIQMHHLMIKGSGLGSLIVTEFMQLVNSSTMAIGSPEEKDEKAGVVIDLKLPRGYKNFETQSYFVEQALVFTEDGFYDTMAVPPGEFQIAFTYALDITSETMDIKKGVTLPTSNVVIFAELGAAELKGLGQATSRATSATGAEVKYYTMSDVPAGTEIAFQIAGLTPKVSRKPTWIILAGVFGAVFVLVVLRMRPRKS